MKQPIALYNGLFSIKAITCSFQVFILFITYIILLLISFYPRKIIYFKNKINYKRIISKLLHISIFNSIKNFIKNSRNTWDKEVIDFIINSLSTSDKKILGLEQSETINNKYLGEKIFNQNTEKRDSIINNKSEQYSIIEYSLICLFVITGSTLLISSGDWVSTFLSIELQSYGLYLIPVLFRNSEKSTSSGLTYFLLGSLASCLILFGISFIYTSTGITLLESFYLLANLSLDANFSTIWYNTDYIQYSVILITIGFLFKISAAPFHYWSPDVYDNAPTIVTIFIALIAKLSLLILLLQFVQYINVNYVNSNIFSWNISLIISSFLSLIIGTVLGLTQARIKRLLAYSTISHLGFILLALSVGSIESIQAFIFYIIIYTLSNLNAFIIIITIGYSLYYYIQNNTQYNELSDKNNSPIQIINQIKGYFFINPILSTCLSIVMFSFIGLPPLVGFFAKLLVLSSAMDKNFFFLVLVAVITSVIGAVYYLGIIKTMYFDKHDYKLYYFSFTKISSHLSLFISILSVLKFVFIFTSKQALKLCIILSLCTLTTYDIITVEFL